MAGRKGGQWKDAMLPLVKYVEQKPKCSLGWTMLGIMEERRGILSAAKKSFKRAVQLVLQEEKAAAGKEATHEPGPDATVVLASTGMEVPVALKRRRTFLNLARVLVRLEEYEAAAKIYDKTFQAASGAEVRQAEYYAIALQKAGRHQAAVDLLSRRVLAGPKGGTLLALVYFDQGSHAKAAAVISSWYALLLLVSSFSLLYGLLPPLSLALSFSLSLPPPFCSRPSIVSRSFQRTASRGKPWPVLRLPWATVP